VKKQENSSLYTATVLGCFLFLTLVSWAAAAKPQLPKEEPLLMGGCGGIYILADPGLLEVEIFKRDLNRRGAPTELRAILAGPDRMVLKEVCIPDDGKPRGKGPGPLQSVRLSYPVTRRGVYVVNVTVSNDRYGTDIRWGFRTTAKKYLVETARGHKDERHTEPIVLTSPGRPADICFHPRKEAFSIEASGLPPSVKQLLLFDSSGSLVLKLPVSKGKAVGTAPPATKGRHAPWRLHLPRAQAIVRIEGLTSWERTDLCPDSCLWTPDPASWFPFLKYRWILFPYNVTVYGEKGRTKEISFRIHNNSFKKADFSLSVEFPGSCWPVEIDRRRITLRARSQGNVTLRFEIPPDGEARICHIRAKPLPDPAFSTYSTLIVKAGEPPASRALRLPISLDPYRHENQKFGWLPDFPVQWEPYFDLENTPFIRGDKQLFFLSGGKWKQPESIPIPVRTTKSDSKIAFDKDNDVYLITKSGGKAYLLHSRDRGRTFRAYDIGGSGAYDIEQFSGHNTPEGPPAIVRAVFLSRDPKVFWRWIYRLELIIVEKRGERLLIHKPVVLSQKCLGVASHSGVPSAVVSRGSRVHVIWAEATDPSIKVPGTPAYVVTYDKAKGRLLGDPVLIGYGAPPNDVHNRPSIVMDSRGYLHALTGTHGSPFNYARSLKPNTAHEGWTKPQSVGRGLPQTYIGFVCGRDDTLHLVFRLWRRRKKPFPLAIHATLAYQRKPPGKSWEPPRILVEAAFSEYSIFYHRLTIDRIGRLFLSYDYWSTYWFYRNDYPADHRALIMSEDGGRSWKLAQTRDFQRRQ